MKEALQILAAARELRSEGLPFAVATVVRIDGSTYRRPGARMLVDEQGNRWGTLSGGCLEGDVARRALEVLRDGRAVVVPFELGDDDVVLGFGTGCDGIVHVLIEPGDPVLSLIDRCFETRVPATLATVILDATVDAGVATDGHDRIGHHLLLPDAEKPDERETTDDIGNSVNPRLDAVIESSITDALPNDSDFSTTHRWHNLTLSFDGHQIEILVERILPPLRLYVFGDGHDANAMIDLARTVGWEVVVVGRKPIDELMRRFPNATQHVFLMHPGELHLRLAAGLLSGGRGATIDARSAAVVMNHNYVRDRALLRILLESDSSGSEAPAGSQQLSYLGLLGPAYRTGRMLDELATEGFTPDEDQRARLFAPIGLDIGTETPEEIALATITEIQSVLHGRTGGHLRSRPGPIHATRPALSTRSHPRS